MPDFECRLKKYRQLKELTQEELAVLVGVRRETIMRLEKAQYNPSLKLIYRGQWKHPLRRFLSFQSEVQEYISFIPHKDFHSLGRGVSHSMPSWSVEQE